jgi:hypothetical protein
MTSHDQAEHDESRGRQAFGEGVSHHFVRAQRHEFEGIQPGPVHAHSTYEYQYDGIFAHRNTRKFDFVQKSGLSLTKSKISSRFT